MLIFLVTLICATLFAKIYDLMPLQNLIFFNLIFYYIKHVCLN